MLGIVASNGEKMPPDWFQQGYRLTSAVYKEVLETKVLSWVKKIIKKSDCVFQHDGESANTAKTVRKIGGSPTLAFGLKTFGPHSHQI